MLVKEISTWRMLIFEKAGNRKLQQKLRNNRKINLN
jgi:hypothetical protein